jgi:3-(3-hydroxy-phenyl)propionate hydroxylase
MLGELGTVEPLIAQGLIAPQFQYRTKHDGQLATFDFSAIADVTKHPFRLQCEQSKLTRILHAQLQTMPDVEIVFGRALRALEQTAEGVTVTLTRHGGQDEQRTGRWLIGADGARSDTRRALGVAFDGFTWPERFLVVSTPYDFKAAIPDLVSVSYVADPQRWHFLLQIPELWRVMFPIAAEESDELALSRDFAQSLMGTIIPGVSDYEIAHVTLYRVHQRDAAHLNNPLGGMGMNGGIHDAMNLTARLAGIWHGKMPESELDRFDKQRRLVTKEHIENQSIQNKKNLESPSSEFKDRIRAIAADPQRSRDYLIGVSMIGSLRRAEQLG